jgi:hypothetical protein
MTYAQALLRLAEHGYGEAPAMDQSFLGSLYLSEKAGIPPEIDRLAADVVECLQIVNEEFNGAKASEIRSGKAGNLPRDLVSRVADISEGAIQYRRKWSQAMTFQAEALQRLERATHMVSFAWAQVLAGDIDNIAEEWRLSEWALGEPGTSPNGGPAERFGRSGVGGGPPSVSYVRRMCYEAA